MTETPRKTDPGEETPAGDTSAGNDGGGPAGPEDPPATASEPAAPPEAANDSDAPEARAPQDGDPAGGGAETAGPDSDEADSGEADPDGTDPAETGAPALTEEQQRIVDLEIEVAELKDRALRAMADADNARKRAARDVADSRKYGATGLARDILTVADNLGRALEAVPDVSREEDENLFNLRTGVDMTLKEMLQALERHGVKKVTPETGERFDHHRHQAMFEVPTGELAPGAVAQVVQDGYVIHDRLLRPALVGVARKPPEEAPPEPEGGAESAAEAPEDAGTPEASAGESDAA